MDLRAISFVTACVYLSLCPPLHASALPPALDDYRITSWTGGDGVTLGAVRAIAQDAFDYLWLGTDTGLVRFDGFRFTKTDLVTGGTPLPRAPIHAVHVTHDGSLWAGYGDGRGVYRIADGEVREVFLAGRIPGFVNVIFEDGGHVVWIGHDGGLDQFRDGVWRHLPIPADGKGQRVFDVHEDRHGTIWVATAAGLFRQRDGVLERLPHVDGIVRAVAEDAAGRLLITDERTAFRTLEPGDATRLFDGRGMNLYLDRRSHLWVTTIGQGIWQVQPVPASPPSARRAGVQTGLMSDENSALFEDRDGNIWVGSAQGLNRLAPHKVLSLVDLGVVGTVSLDAAGTAWAGTAAGLVRLTGLTARTPGRRRVVSTMAIRALHTDRNGTLWAATANGLARVSGARLMSAGPAAARLSRIVSITSDSRGALWVCDEARGLVRVTTSGDVSSVSLADGTSARPTFAYVDAADRVWVALQDGSLSTLDSSGTTQHFGPEHGLMHTAIYAIHHDAQGELWVGGDGGLSHFRGGRFSTLPIRNEAPRRAVTSLADDDAGDLWVGLALFGFVRIARDDVTRALQNPASRLQYRVYGTADGAGYPGTFYAGSTARAADGSLLFVTSRGVTVIDPDALRHDPAATIAPPRIESVTADDRRYAIDARLSLPERTTRLRIDYTVVSLSSPDRVKFRYRIDGVDRGWVDGTGPHQASYTNLPPGHHRFLVQASSDATPWEGAQAELSFSIQPAFYQTGWFRAFLVFVLSLCAMGAWRLRMRQVRREFSGVLGERIRLSREIHDTLLQSLVGLSLQLESASRDAADAGSCVRTQLLVMRRQVESYIREARQSIWHLRSPTLEKHGLVEALRETGDRLTAGRVPFMLTTTGRPRPCPSSLETEVLRIGHEAIMNAVRHARARRVYAEIGFDERLLRLRVTDDGCGFAYRDGPHADADDHYGLLSMRERASEAGGRCTITSSPGSGVQVVAEFPLDPALTR